MIDLTTRNLEELYCRRVCLFLFGRARQSFDKDHVD